MQTLGVFRELHADLWGTLATLRDGGVSYLEVLTDWGADPAMLAKYRELSGGIESGWPRAAIRERLPRLRAMGLDIEGMFVSLDRLEPEVAELASFCIELGIRYVVFSPTPVGDDFAKCREIVARILAVGRVLQAAGVEMVLHDHDTDFVVVHDGSGAGKTLYERILEGCEEIGLGAELDVGWATYAGVDVPGLIRRLGPRVRILHVKDIASGFAAMARDRIYVPAGQGACDYPAAFAAADRYARPDYRIVLDQDPSDRDGVADNLASAAYLARWTDR
jgi:sugar phosphate isomerase/epimerase